jgi:hypothetical protein
MAGSKQKPECGGVVTRYLGVLGKSLLGGGTVSIRLLLGVPRSEV